MTSYKPSDEALAAASWVVEMDNNQERRRLWNGHKMRRQPIERNGYHATDHSAADAWLVEQWQAAGSPTT